MQPITRRNLIRNSISVAAGLSLGSKIAFAKGLDLPPAIQLYSVRTQMAENLDEALAAVAAAGYKEVESAALPKISAKEVRAALDKAGLTCVSSHQSFADLSTHFDETVEYDSQLGSKYIICSSPGFRPSNDQSGPRRTPTIDDWRYNAEQFNVISEKMAKAGIALGYHNHVHEFEMIDGTMPYLELLRIADPKKVTFELDCGWAKVAGQDPVQLMKDHPYRFSMLHVKDFHLPPKPTFDTSEAKVTELGRGDIDYRPIFRQAAENQRIKHAFVEQEAFDMPWKDSLKIDAQYLATLRS
jgi:sugar phosphate isomerase/epimerase